LFLVTNGIQIIRGVKKLTKDFLRLDKLDKELTNIFKSKPTKTQNKGGKQKPIMTKHQQTEAKKFIKETGSAFSGIIKNIKNRKIRKLEKETLNNIERSQALAHKIKTIEANNDALTDISLSCQ